VRSALPDADDTHASMSQIVSRPVSSPFEAASNVYEDGFPREQFTKPHVGTDEFIG